MGGSFIGINVLGITDITAFAIICSIIGFIFLFAAYLILKHRREQDLIAEKVLSRENTRLVSREKDSLQPVIPEARESAREDDGSATGPDTDKPLDTLELTRNQKTITASLQALARKYSLFEITLATDDGLVFASSAERDVRADAAKYSQIMMQKSSPDEPNVTLFELDHKGSHLVGIIRTKNELLQNGETGIRDDTKGILQWWL